MVRMKNRYFGTDGIRGRVGENPVTADFMLRLGRAAGRTLADGDSRSVVIGKDTRISGYMFESALEAGLAAAGALLDSNSLEAREVVLALLAGNVLSAPMRAVRHQFPFYAGVFQPRLALELITYNQLFRTGSIIFVGVLYYFLSS